MRKRINKLFSYRGNAIVNLDKLKRMNSVGENPRYILIDVNEERYDYCEYDWKTEKIIMLDEID